MTDKQFFHKLAAVRGDIDKLVSDKWPRKAGVMAVNIFNENFRKGGFLNKVRVAWRRTQRQNNPRMTKAGKTTAASSYGPLLSSRRHLSRSNEKIVSNGQVTIVNKVPYAAVHNDGGRAGRGHKTEIPKRTFIGPSETLNKQIKDMIVEDLDKLLKK